MTAYVIIGITLLALSVWPAVNLYHYYGENKRQVWERCKLSPYVVGAPVNKMRGVLKVAVGFPKDWDEVVPFFVGYRDQDGQEWLCTSHKEKAYWFLMEVGDAHDVVFAVDARTRMQIVVRIVDHFPAMVGQFRFKHSRTAG